MGESKTKCVSFKHSLSSIDKCRSKIGGSSAKNSVAFFVFYIDIRTMSYKHKRNLAHKTKKPQKELEDKTTSDFECGDARFIDWEIDLTCLSSQITE